MKRSFIRSSLLILPFFLMACSDQTDQQQNQEHTTLAVDAALVTAVYEAADKRSFDAGLLRRAVDAGFPAALSMFGHIGGNACADIRYYLGSDNPAIAAAAAQGAAHCLDTRAFDALMLIIQRGETPAARITALQALGFAAGENDRPRIAALVTKFLGTADDAPDVAAAAVYGLMQNITYAGLSPADLPALDINAVMKAAARDDRLGFESAYLLMRMRDLPSVLRFEDIVAAIDASSQPEKTYALLRVAGQFGNAATDILRAYSTHETQIEGDLSTDMFDDNVIKLATAGAVNAAANLNDEASLTHLFTLLNDPDVAVQQMALSVMARRSDADAGVVKRMWDFARGDNAWLAVTAAEGLIGFKDENALYLAENWLHSGSFYRAFRAVGLLAGSDTGKALLQSYVDDGKDPVRVQMASTALDGTSAVARTARRTVAYDIAKMAIGKRMKLTTTRGDIVIEMIEGAPYAAHNFITQAETGKLDGMVWHRVIPGFVAQAGQRDTMAQFETPTIREEWDAARHMPGTVGVATSGPDTGTVQFFINLMHNRHLDGRYTVFGRVVSGPYGALQEGDVIINAKVEASE